MLKRKGRSLIFRRHYKYNRFALGILGAANYATAHVAYSYLTMKTDMKKIYILENRLMRHWIFFYYLRYLIFSPTRTHIYCLAIVRIHSFLVSTHRTFSLPLRLAPSFILWLRLQLSRCPWTRVHMQTAHSVYMNWGDAYYDSLNLSQVSLYVSSFLYTCITQKF